MSFLRQYLLDSPTGAFELSPITILYDPHSFVQASSLASSSNIDEFPLPIRASAGTQSLVSFARRVAGA